MKGLEMDSRNLNDKALSAAQKLSNGALLTLDEVSAMFDLSHSTIHRLPLPSLRIGRSLRYDPQDVRKLIEASREPIAA
jgi:hypothetical protein